MVSSAGKPEMVGSKSLKVISNAPTLMSDEKPEMVVSEGLKDL